MRLALRIALAVAVVAAATRAEAIPAFARKYGMSCTACHLAWPILNQQGQLFRDNGYQFGTEKDEPVTQAPAYWPIAVRTTAAYGYTRTTNQPSDAGPVTTVTGRRAADPRRRPAHRRDHRQGHLLPGGPDRLQPAATSAAFAESAWVRLDNLGGSSWANLKVGKFEVDLPASAHRGVPLTNGYAIYGPRPAAACPSTSRRTRWAWSSTATTLRRGHPLRHLAGLRQRRLRAGRAPGRRRWSTPTSSRPSRPDSEVLPWIRVGRPGRARLVAHHLRHADPGGWHDQTSPAPVATTRPTRASAAR